MVAAAVGAAAVAGSMYSANQQSDAIKDAANTQQASTDASVNFQRDALEQQRNDLRPFRYLGQMDRNGSPINAFKKLAMGQENYAFNPSTDPVLNNALNRTARAVMDAQAANGKLGSGSTLTSLVEAMAPVTMNREQQVFDNRYNANNQQFNQLQTIIGMAQNAAAGQGTATANTANNITNLMNNNANAQGAAGIAQANNQANMLNNLMGAGMMAYGMYNQGAK